MPWQKGVTGNPLGITNPAKIREVLTAKRASGWVNHPLKAGERLTMNVRFTLLQKEKWERLAKSLQMNFSEMIRAALEDYEESLQ